jgi:hypothetical protein
VLFGNAANTIGTHPRDQKFFGSFFQKRTASFFPALPYGKGIKMKTYLLFS